MEDIVFYEPVPYKVVFLREEPAKGQQIEKKSYLKLCFIETLSRRNMPTFAIVKKYDISTCTLSSAEEKKASFCRNIYIYCQKISDVEFRTLLIPFRKMFGRNISDTLLKQSLSTFGPTKLEVD